jgi:hypothetical protein
VTVRSGVWLEDALIEARRIDEVRQAAGFDQVALEVAARQGLSNGAFEESEDEGGEVVDEFFPEGVAEDCTTVSGAVSPEGAGARSRKASPLSEKLETQALRMAQRGESAALA